LFFVVVFIILNIYVGYSGSDCCNSGYRQPLQLDSSHVDALSREAIGPAVERSTDVLVRDDLKGPREPHGFAVQGNHIVRGYGVLPAHLLDDEFRVSSYSQPANALILGCKQALKQRTVLCFIVGYREFSD
jgi:hypothetical protein